jgi:hypothetical protein
MTSAITDQLLSSPIKRMTDVPQTIRLLQNGADISNGQITISDYNPVSYKDVLDRIIILLILQEKTSKEKRNEALTLIHQVSELSRSLREEENRVVSAFKNCLSTCCCCLAYTAACKSACIENCLKLDFAEPNEMAPHSPPSPFVMD